MSNEMLGLLIKVVLGLFGVVVVRIFDSKQVCK